MGLSKGDIIKLISADLKAAVLFDWINFRNSAVGDVVLVEEVSTVESGQIIRLLCESRPGFSAWCISIREAGITYELLIKATSA